MSEPPDNPTVLGATVLSNYAYTDGVGLLKELPRVCTTPKVRREISEGVDRYPYLQEALDKIGGEGDISVVELTEKEEERAERHLDCLDPGESEALAVVKERDGTIVTDDGKARSVARQEEVPVTGSIGILVAKVESDRVDEEEAERWTPKVGRRNRIQGSL